MLCSRASVYNFIHKLISARLCHCELPRRNPSMALISDEIRIDRVSRKIDSSSQPLGETLGVPWDIERFYLSCCAMESDNQRPRGKWLQWEIWKKKECLTCLSFSTLPADDLAPLGARSSAGTVMTNYKSRIYTHEQDTTTWVLHVK